MDSNSLVNRLSLNMVFHEENHLSDTSGQVMGRSQEYYHDYIAPTIDRKSVV